MPDKREILTAIPAVAAMLPDADVIDHKTAEGDRTLREFVAAMMSYQPAWVTFLYRVRAGLVRLMGFKQGGIPRPEPMKPADLSFTPGEFAYFFKVVNGEEDKYWFGQASDPHLRAALGVVLEPLDDGRTRYHVVTLVYYHKFIGRLYYNLIRPFHHIIVRLMIRDALKPAKTPRGTAASHAG